MAMLQCCVAEESFYTVRAKRINSLKRFVVYLRAYDLGFSANRLTDLIVRSSSRESYRSFVVIKALSWNPGTR